MPSFLTARGSRLTFDVLGDGVPLVCVPGGPLLRSDYLGDLGGLSDHARLIRFNPPGSEGATETDDSAYRCDHVAEDLEALRHHLGLEKLTLLAHSAGANIALRYAERHPERIERLLLVTPSTRAVGLHISDETRAAAARARSHEPWYPDASAALARIQAGQPSTDDWSAITPFSYGRWDATATEHDALITAHRHPTIAALFDADGAFTPAATREALTGLKAPITVIAGQVDLFAPPAALRALVDLLTTSTLTIQPAAGHYPWIDDPNTFVMLVRNALK